MMQEDTSSSPSTHSQSKETGRENSGSGLFRKLKNLDFYQKLDENFSVQTSGGATMTLIGWIIIAALVLAEVRHYRNPEFKEHMVVDTTLGEKLKVNLNITFHALNCEEAHLDAMDVAGDNQLNIEHMMVKRRIAKDGKPFGKEGVEMIGEGKLNAKDHADLKSLGPDYCGDCYGAQSTNVSCCNSCHDLIQAYQVKSWSIESILRNSTQCLRDRATQFKDVNHDEGCTISGSMKVRMVVWCK